MYVTVKTENNIQDRVMEWVMCHLWTCGCTGNMQNSNLRTVTNKPSATVVILLSKVYF